MKFFTPLHDTLHAVTEQLSPKRQASPMTSTAHQCSAGQAPKPQAISIPKRLPKCRRLSHSPKNQDESPASNSSPKLSGVLIEQATAPQDSERQLYCLPSQRFSSFDRVGAVLKASRSLPRIPISAQISTLTLSETPPHPRRSASADIQPRSTGYRHPSLYFLPINAAGLGEALAPASQPQDVSPQSLLSDGIWTKDGSIDHAFLQDFMSAEAQILVADITVPSLLARRLMKAERNLFDFMPEGPQQPPLGSWEFVLQHFSCSIMEESNGRHTWIPHHILPQCQAAPQHLTSDPVTPPGNPSPLDIISQASVRQPTTLVLKQTQTPDVDSEILFFSFSKGNHIASPLPSSLNPSPPGWSRLEELALDCFISDADAFQLFNDCSNTLRTAVLNLCEQGVSLIATTNTPKTQMPVLSSLSITSSLPLEPLASAFAFPALRELSLTLFESTESSGLGLIHTEQNTKLSAALQFPWSTLAQLTLRNSTCDTPHVEDILARCGSLASFTWKDRYSTESQLSMPPLSLPLLEELTINANECRPLLQSITRANMRAVKKLSLRCCDEGMVEDLPDNLSDLVVQESMALGICASVFERLSNGLVWGNVSVRSGELDPLQGTIHMKALRRICL
ncbi:hypothetical protein D9619_008083 [Psilocybe cf. subviscida]|uniref:Uncharacterized protein n=1 Tax=Psilocybe cf. subviscida TaxID=2480587 RepID=A0A8H5ET03_9AGAR|nr:hypothetical protein D9619_008083 [Psilocybe cf. subviscida]